MEVPRPVEHAAPVEALYGPNPLLFRRGAFPPSWGIPPAEAEARGRWIRSHAQVEHGYKHPRRLVEMLDAQVESENRLRLLDLLAKAISP